MIKFALQVLASQARVDVLIKKNPELGNHIQEVADADPSGGKQKYLQWAVNKLKAGYDLEETIEALKSFHKAQKLLDEKDLNKYKTPKEVLKKSKRVLEEEGQAKKPELVFKRPGLNVYQVFTKTQMCEIGEGTKWCTAHVGGTYWDEYVSKPGWRFYVVEVSNERYLAYFVGDTLKEIRDARDKLAVPARQYLVEAGLTDEDAGYANWPQWLQEAQIEDADVSIIDDVVYWHDGVWADGVWEDGVWESGTWKKGIWKKGRWETGDWQDGEWQDGEWRGGLWRDGVWKAGTWLGGIWRDGWWDSGVWKAGKWEAGDWYGGAWENGLWKDGVWHAGVWRDGDWRRGLFLDGAWWDGAWWDGEWGDGEGHQGTWLGGEWREGFREIDAVMTYTTESPESG